MDDLPVTEKIRVIRCMNVAASRSRIARKGDKRGGNCRSRFEGNRLSLHLKMTQQITIKPTTGFTTPPKGMEFTATIRETKRGGIHGKSNYGATAEIAKANLMARLESEGHQFEDADGNPVTQYVQPDGMLSDTPERYAVNYISHYSGKVLQTRDYKNIADAHDHCEELRDKGLWAEVVVVEISEDEYEPNFNGFISTVTGKEIATVGVVVLMFVSIWFAV